jgi:hypothetical protein
MEDFPDVPEWHGFESQVWEIGEQIRQLLAQYPFLRKDEEMQEAFIRISANANAKCKAGPAEFRDATWIQVLASTVSAVRRAGAGLTKQKQLLLH